VIVALVVFLLLALAAGVRPTAAQTVSPTVSSASSAASISLPPASPRIRAYNRTWYTLYFVGTAWEMLGLGLLLRFRVGPALRDAVERRTLNRFLQAALFFAVLSLLLALWRLPLGYYAYAFDRSYGFARQSFGLWLTDRGRAYLIGLPSAIAVWLGYWLLRRSPRRWWLWLWAAAVPWIAAQAALWPVVIAPLYNRFVPMPESPLRTRLLDLASRAGIQGAQVYVVDISRRTTKLNAYVAGIGPTKRIVIWDTTLKALSEDEVAAIMGHEMGHYVLHHVWWSAIAGSGGAFIILWLLSRALPWTIRRWGASLGIRGIDDLAGLPLVLLLLYVVLFLQTPAASALSRYQEHEADRFGLELTGLNEATARAFISFVNRDYADPDPPPFIVFWFYTHPPLRDRVDFALTYHAGR
jgi:Zn-dependent protease with chaperone function